jgi:N-terminal TM domain of oligopeptide transport permease C
MSSEQGLRDELTIGPPGSQFTMPPAEGPADSSEELTYQYGLEVEARSQWAYARRRFLRHRLAVGSLVVILMIFGAGVFANFIAPYSYQEINLNALSRGITSSAPTAPGATRSAGCSTGSGRRPGSAFSSVSSRR